MDLSQEAAGALGKIAESIPDKAQVSQSFNGATPALVKALAHRNSSIRTAAAATLEKFGWTPAHPEQQALYLIAKEQWFTVVELGSVSIPSLVMVVSAEGMRAAPALKNWRKRHGLGP